MRFSALISAAALAAPLASALNPIAVSGRYFVDNVTGDPFWIKGVDYQPGGSADFEDGVDVLANTETCARDIYLLQQLGVNTIRVYAVDPTLDHDECMTMMASAGIYLILDVNTPIYSQSLNRDEPWTTYTETYLSHVFQVIEAFSGYNNTLGYFAGNEVINNSTSAEASPPYVKAVVRDMKQYISKHILRQIPVGYSAADDTRYRVSLPDYLECGPEDESIDFYGVNSYQWCGDQTYTSSGYDILVDAYLNFSVPMFLSEYGCNLVTPRTFQEVGTIFSNNFTSVFSGGLAYEFSQEDNAYGLVTIDSDGGASVMSDYTALSTRYAAVETSTLTTDTSSTARPTKCAATYANINGNTTLPTCQASSLLSAGLDSSYNRGRLISGAVLTTNYTIYDIDGNAIDNVTIAVTEDLAISDDTAIEQTDKTTPRSAGSSSGTSSRVASKTASSTASGSAASATASSAAEHAFAAGPLSLVAVVFGLFFL
ncbi:Glucanosyltransferase-domain-containing protein [Dipodascopsis tothii]|uniref:Glucanosyltransferase-domain-containing protein n=1 Tax=Dipodascopsis tothii TaxID=44089 RepID=UPI0034CF47C8